uniref:Thiaminase-2/PQQC domain-containing protein n=1 Tax=Cyprinodon variegatus TaxID=28743 RepID=A0A3Q2CY44_CYPVA
MSTNLVLSTYDVLWQDNQDVAEQSLKQPFLQHMQSGDLQADDYMKFMIQDINYLVKVTEMLEEMSKRNMENDIYLFMVDRYKSYKKYADSVPDVKPIPAMAKYLSDYRTIMNEEEPILFAVALLPCERLRMWLAKQLKESKSNAYYTWKLDNMYGHPEKHFRKLLDDHLNTTELIQKANVIFRQQMQNEENFFRASLPPPPIKK